MAGKVNGILTFAGVRALSAMSLPPDDISPFAARRQRLMDQMRAEGGGIASLASSWAMRTPLRTQIRANL